MIYYLATIANPESITKSTGVSCRSRNSGTLYSPCIFVIFYFLRLCQLNGYIARNEALEWGKLRTGSVGISGTDYLPPVPTEEAMIAGLAEILSSATPPPPQRR